MKQTIQKIFKNETLLAVLLIFLTTLITYALSFPALGYYHDDWYLLWSGQARGAQSIIPLFSTDRPFMGVVYSYVYRLLGDTIINWHVYALLWRFIGGVAFFWILRLIWPNQKYITTLMAVLFIVYPGFLSQPNANTKQNHLYGFGTALLSIALMLQALKTSNHRWKFICSLLSFIFTVNYLFIYEYMIGLEGMRLVLLGYALNGQGFKNVRSFATAFVKKWWPYPLAMAGFLYWRIFIFESSRNATDAARLAGSYLGNLRSMSLRLVFETVKDFLDTSLFAWFFKPTQLFANATYSILVSSFLVAGLVIGLVLLYSFLLKRCCSDAEEPASMIRDLFWMGAFSLVCAIVPVVLSGREVDLTDAYKSYGLHPIGGVMMLVAAAALMLKADFRKLFLIGLIGLSVSTQVLNANIWARLWEYQRETWWQLSWRAPDIIDDTLVMAYYPDGYRVQQDYEVWGPLNLIYRPGSAEAPAIQAEVLTSDTALDVLRKDVFDNRVRDIKLHRDYNNLLLLSLPSDNACIHVIDGSLPVYAENEALIVKQVGAYSQVDRIVPTGTAPTPSAHIFGSEPSHGWCYIYQKAGLARQAGNWAEIAKLYAQAVDLGLKPGDQSEMIPFFEALVNLGRYDEAQAFYNEQIKGRAKLRFPLCEALASDPQYPPAFGYDTKMVYKILCE